VQMGTSHNLGQGFTKGFDVTYKGSDEQMHNPFYSSWGVSTRLLGATIMTHSDDKGLVLPPGLVKQKVVIIPMSHKNNVGEIAQAVAKIALELKEFGAYVDDRDDYSMGWKMNEHELKGVPIVLILGGRELEANQITLKVRDADEKQQVCLDDLSGLISTELSSLHTRLYDNAKAQSDSKIVEVSSKEEFGATLEKGLVAKALFCGSKECEAEIEAEHGVSSRCIDSAPIADDAKCIFSGKPAIGWVYFSRSY